MTIPQFMLFSFIVLILLGGMVYCAVDRYEPAKIPVIFDAKHLDKYPLDKSNFFAKDSGDWHYVLGIPEGVTVYGFPPGYNIDRAVQALGLKPSDFTEDWVGGPHSRTYYVDIGDIWALEFNRAEYALGHAWGYSDVDIKFKKAWDWRKNDQNKM